MRYPGLQTITKELALEWATLGEDEKPNSLQARVSPIRQLARYMNSIGIEAFLIPAAIPKVTSDYTPHIFTQGELAAFFSAIDHCPHITEYPQRHLIIPVFFRLIYCCGLRSSEARFLRTEDIDLASGTILIRQAKHHKDRYVVMSDDLVGLCRAYEEEISQIFPERYAFFPNRSNGFYATSVPYQQFHKFWDVVAPGTKACVHDFRHTYAVNRLNSWVEDGQDIQTLLPYLSAYMGHSDFRYTDYYLHLVPDFYPTLRKMSTSACEDIIPEVCYG
jgi:integrase